MTAAAAFGFKETQVLRRNPPDSTSHKPIWPWKRCRSESEAEKQGKSNNQLGEGLTQGTPV